MNTQRTYTVQDAAKMIGIGPQKLFAWLREHKLIDKRNVPYQRYIDQGILKVKTGCWYHEEAGPQHYAQTKITNKGIEWLQQQLQREETSCQL